jgi:hypothetical protein
MTARHALTGDRGIKACTDPAHLCSGALVIADGPLAGRDVRDPWQPEYVPRHAPWPYTTWDHGALVEYDDERNLHDTRFPITGGLYDGYEVGGRS